MFKIKILKEFTENKKECKDVRDIRTLLISNQRDSFFSNAEQNTVHSEVQGIFHTNRQHDAYESLLIILDILHNHTKIDLFPCLAFSQEAMKYSSIIRNTFYGIINSTISSNLSLRLHLKGILALVYLCLNKIWLFMQ